MAILLEYLSEYFNFVSPTSAELSPFQKQKTTLSFTKKYNTTKETFMLKICYQCLFHLQSIDLADESDFRKCKLCTLKRLDRIEFQKLHQGVLCNEDL